MILILCSDPGKSRLDGINAIFATTSDASRSDISFLFHAFPANVLSIECLSDVSRRVAHPTKSTREHVTIFLSECRPFRSSKY